MKIIMSKRRLNKQQLERIASNHAAVSQSADDIDLLHGLVITHYGKEVEVLRLNADKTIASYPLLSAVMLSCGEHLPLTVLQELSKRYLSESPF